MDPVESLLPPSSSLPALGTLHKLSEEQLFCVLQGLSALYCPLPTSVALNLSPGTRALSDGTSTPLVDSGYASGIEDDEEDGEDVAKVDDALDVLRADGFERSFVERWLTGFIGRAAALPCLESEDALERALDQASWILESFVCPTFEEEQQMDKELGDYMRDFSFQLSLSDSNQETIPVNVQLNDGLAGKDSKDCDDVGLQSWGASIVFSDLMCTSPSRFGLTKSALGDSPHIIELGAGTGLVSLVLGDMLPHLGVTRPTVVATDYHPSVLANLRSNIEANTTQKEHALVQVCLLDWSAPVLEPPLDAPADMLIATDVVYAPEHAIWLRDCATLLLAPEGVFWLVATVRQNGRFEGISDTVEAAFATEDRPRGKDGRLLSIIHSEKLEKRNQVGRGDESGYKMFKLGWV